jgi:hypothetical protein
VKGNLTLFTDEVRVLIARVEQHAGLIIKDELKGAAPPPVVPKRARPKKQ